MPLILKTSVSWQGVNTCAVCKVDIILKYHADLLYIHYLPPPERSCFCFCWSVDLSECCGWNFVKFVDGTRNNRSDLRSDLECAFIFFNIVMVLHVAYTVELTIMWNSVVTGVGQETARNANICDNRWHRQARLALTEVCTLCMFCSSFFSSDTPVQVLS